MTDLAANVKSTKLRIRENYAIVLPVNILADEACPHDVLLCGHAYQWYTTTNRMIFCCGDALHTVHHIPNFN